MACHLRLDKSKGLLKRRLGEQLSFLLGLCHTASLKVHLAVVFLIGRGPVGSWVLWVSSGLYLQGSRILMLLRLLVRAWAFLLLVILMLWRLPLRARVFRFFVILIVVR